MTIQYSAGFITEWTAGNGRECLMIEGVIVKGTIICVCPFVVTKSDIGTLLCSHTAQDTLFFSEISIGLTYKLEIL